MRSLARTLTTGMVALLTAALPTSASAQLGPDSGVLVAVVPPKSVADGAEAVTVRVSVQNFSTADVRRSDTAGGAVVRLEIPAGLSYVAGSGRVVLGDGSSAALVDPSGPDGGPLSVAGGQGVDLLQNQRLLYSYQLAATGAARDGQIYRHGAVVQTAAGTVISPSAAGEIAYKAPPAPVAVAAPTDDATARTGSLRGSVFCDGDRDGLHDPTERGISGVRVVTGEGVTGTSDGGGRFVLGTLAEGSHLVAVERATLPSGAELTTSDKHFTYVSAGLSAWVAIGVACDEPARSAGDRAAALPGHRSPARVQRAGAVTVTGNVKRGVVAVNARPLSRIVASLAIDRVKGRSTNIPWRPGKLSRDLVFRTSLSAETAALPGLRWSLEIREHDGGLGRLVRAIHGQGPPPAQIRWNGTEAGTTVSVLERGKRYDAALSLTAGPHTGRYTAAPVAIGVAYGADTATLHRGTARGVLLDKSLAPTKRLQRALKAAARKMRNKKGSRVIIEIHVDASEVPEADMMKTRRAAFNVGDWARKTLKLSGDRVLAVGLGGSRPLRPNVSERNQAFNRRVEIVVLPQEDPGAFPEVPVAEVRPQITISGQPLDVGPDGSFLHVSPMRADRPLPIRVLDANGAELVVAYASQHLSTSGQDQSPGGGPMPPGAGMAPPAPAGQPSATDPLRRFGGQALKAVIGSEAIVTD